MSAFENRVSVVYNNITLTRYTVLLQCIHMYVHHMTMIPNRPMPLIV